MQCIDTVRAKVSLARIHFVYRRHRSRRLGADNWRSGHSANRDGDIAVRRVGGSVRIYIDVLAKRDGAGRRIGVLDQYVAVSGIDPAVVLDVQSASAGNQVD